MRDVFRVYGALKAWPSVTVFLLTDVGACRSLLGKLRQSCHCGALAASSELGRAVNEALSEKNRLQPPVPPPVGRGNKRKCSVDGVALAGSARAAAAAGYDSSSQSDGKPPVPARSGRRSGAVVPLPAAAPTPSPTLHKCAQPAQATAAMHVPLPAGVKQVSPPYVQSPQYSSDAATLQSSPEDTWNGIDDVYDDGDGLSEHDYDGIDLVDEYPELWQGSDLMSPHGCNDSFPFVESHTPTAVSQPAAAPTAVTADVSMFDAIPLESLDVNFDGDHFAHLFDDAPSTAATLPTSQPPARHATPSPRSSSLPSAGLGTVLFSVLFCVALFTVPGMLNMNTPSASPLAASLADSNNGVSSSSSSSDAFLQPSM